MLKSNNSLAVIQSLAKKEIKIAIVTGKIIPNIKAKIPSLTPSPLGANKAATPIALANKKAPITKVKFCAETLGYNEIIKNKNAAPLLKEHKIYKSRDLIIS